MITLIKNLSKETVAQKVQNTSNVSAPTAQTDTAATNVKSGYQKGKLISGGLNLVHGISNRAEVRLPIFE